MKRIVLYLLFSSILISSAPSTLLASSRVSKIIKIDTTERLENIQILKKSLKEMNSELSVLNTALAIAKKKPNHKKLYSNTKKFSDAITALTIVSGTIATYYLNKEIKILKLAAVSTAVSIIMSLMNDLSPGDIEQVEEKISELKLLINASNINLANEEKALCAQEPSNQMCL